MCLLTNNCDWIGEVMLGSRVGHVYVSLTNGSRESIGPSRCKRGGGCKRWVCPFLN